MASSLAIAGRKIAGKILAVSIVMGISMQTASAEQSTPPYANALRRAVVFEDNPGSTFSLAERMARWKVPGVSVAIIDNCTVIDGRGFGVTRDGGLEVQPDTLFQAASVTKPITALAALRLVDQGILSLDSDVNAELQTWNLPESPLLDEHPITLRGILSHSAGLVPGGYGGYTHDEPVPTLIETLAGVRPARPKPVKVAYAPGSSWRYSGGGYLVAQLLLTEKTGRSFGDVIHDQVLVPTGMNRSSFAEPSASGNVASGHSADGTMVPGGWHLYPELAAASLWSTAPDLARFGAAVMKAVRGEPDAVLSSSLARQMAEAHAGPRSLGFEVGGKGNAHHIGHEGTNEGYNSSLILYPATCQGAAIMANSDNAKPLIAELLRGIADTYHWPDTMPSTVVQRSPLQVSGVARFQGTYRFTDISGIAPFEIIPASGGSFIFDRGDGHLEPLYPSSEGLIGPDSGIAIKVVSPAKGPASVITYSRIGGNGASRAERVEPGQDASPTVGSSISSSEDVLARIAESYVAAQFAFDQQTLRELTAENFVEISPQGEVDERSAVIGFYAPEKKRAAPRFSIANQKVRITGTMAVITQFVTIGIPPRSMTLSQASTAAFQDGHWKLTSSQSTPVPTKTD